MCILLFKCILFGVWLICMQIHTQLDLFYSSAHKIITAAVHGKKLSMVRSQLSCNNDAIARVKMSSMVRSQLSCNNDDIVHVKKSSMDRSQHPERQSTINRPPERHTRGWLCHQPRILIIFFIMLFFRNGSLVDFIGIHIRRNCASSYGLHFLVASHLFSPYLTIWFMSSGSRDLV